MKYNFIVEEKNKKCEPPFEELEIEIVRLLCSRNMNDAYKKILLLYNIYPQNETLIKICELCTVWYELFNKNKVEFKRDTNQYVADIDSVIESLLESKDYYRLYEVLDDVINSYKVYDDYDIKMNNTGSGKEFNIKWLVYYYLVKDIISLYDANQVDETRKIMIKTHDSNLSKLVKDKKLSSISSWLLKENELKLQIRIDKNYLNEFNSYYNQHDYNNAYKSLKHAICKFMDMDVFMNLDYQIKELFFLLGTQIPDKYKKYIDDACECLKDEDYLKANMYFKNAYELVKNKRINAKRGMCMYHLGNKEEAIKLFISASDYISPDEMVYLIELLYKRQNWGLITHYFQKYYEYYTDENLTLDYATIIAYIKLNMLEEAKDLLIKTKEVYDFIYYDEGIKEEKLDNDVLSLDWSKLNQSNHLQICMKFEKLLKDINIKKLKYSKD